MPHAIFFEPPIETNYLGHQLKEMYVDNVYAPFLQGKKDLTIIDLGANLGMFTYYASRFAKKLYAIEPTVEHFDMLTRMIEFNKLTNVEPINKAVYIKSGQYPLFKPEQNKTMNSLHQNVVQGNPNPQHEMVECITLPQLFADFAIDHVDFMKTDIEGTEVELFSSTSFKEVAPKIDVIVTELHAWNDRNPNQLLEAFKNNNFSVQRIPNDASLFVATRNQ